MNYLTIPSKQANTRAWYAYGGINLFLAGCVVQKSGSEDLLYGEHVNGVPALGILAWKIDKENYVAIPLMSDGREGLLLFLRELFKYQRGSEASQ